MKDKFQVSCYTKSQRETVALGLMKIATMLMDNKWAVIDGGITIQPSLDGVKLDSNIVLGELNG
ncbi:MAG TPA: hypothetical protein VL946_06510 [Lacibacter sp.]|nr:hypothetical protein [Lacibacter sp.]